MHFLLALIDVTPSIVDGFLSDVKGWAQLITSGGFGWLVWWLITKTIPEERKSHREHSEKQLTAFTSSLDTCRATFSSEMASQRAGCREEMKDIAQMHEKNIDRLLSQRVRA